MNENSYHFDIPAQNKSIIKVIGVGGGGSNAVNHMYDKGITDVEFIVVNTDSQALKNSPVPNVLQIGLNLTQGLGAGANPEQGRGAALENKEEIREMLGDGTKMLFVTAGMGGGTGTGAAPVIAEVAKDLEILTVGIVTIPFRFEGKKKMRQAVEGVEELKKYCDTVIVIMNDKLKALFGNLPIRQAFSKADEILATAAKSIAEIISVHAEINVDFEDVKTVMKDSTASVMGSAITQGDARAQRAAEEAISSPLLNSKDIQGAKKILLSIMSGSDAELHMDELSDITEFIQERAGDDADIIWGHGIDDSLGENIRVTVIATGFISDVSVIDQVGMSDSEKKKVQDKLDSNNVESISLNPASNTRSTYSEPTTEKPPVNVVEPFRGSDDSESKAFQSNNSNQGVEQGSSNFNSTPPTPTPEVEANSTELDRNPVSDKPVGFNDFRSQDSLSNQNLNSNPVNPNPVKRAFDNPFAEKIESENPVRPAQPYQAPQVKYDLESPSDNFQNKDNVGLDDNFEIVDKKDLNSPVNNQSERGPSDLEKKRMEMKRRSDERIERILKERYANNASNHEDDEATRLKRGIPAYLRKEKELKDLPPTNQWNVTNFNENEEVNKPRNNNPYNQDNFNSNNEGN